MSVHMAMFRVQLRHHNLCGVRMRLQSGVSAHRPQLRASSPHRSTKRSQNVYLHVLCRPRDYFYVSVLVSVFVSVSTLVCI